MTPTLSPQQREEVLELLARAYDKEDAAQRGEEDPWIVEDIEGDTEAERAWQADRKACAAQALDAALPAIIGAVLEPLLEWRDARQAIFDLGAQGQVSAEQWTRLGHAESKLMELARALAEEARS